MPAPLEDAVRSLLDAAETGQPPEQISALAQIIVQAAPSADTAAREHALRQLSPLVASPTLSTVVLVAILCGALVEIGADPVIVAPAILARLEELVADTLPLAAACHQGRISEVNPDDPDTLAAALGEETVTKLGANFTEGLKAWRALDMYYRAVIALLSRSKAARRQTGDNQALREGVHFLAPLHQGLGWVDKMLAVLDDEELIVLHPILKRGYRIEISGIGDNFQLHTLLANALIGDPDAGWLPGNRPDPRIVAVTRDAEPTEGLTATGVFNLYNFNALAPSGTLPEGTVNAATWIWGEGVPADILFFEGIRVILLGPPPYVRTWNAQRTFQAMIGELKVIETLSADAVQTWLMRIGRFNGGGVSEGEPDSPQMYLKRAVERQKRGDLDGALADLNACIRLAPDFEKAYIQRSMIHGMRGDTDGVIADTTEAIRLNPDSADGHMNRGVARWQTGDSLGAIADYDQAIRLAPNFAGAYCNRAAARDKMGLYDDAIADCDEAIRLNPAYATAYNNRAYTRWHMKDYQKGLADVEQAIKLNPRQSYYYHTRGELRASLGDYPGAIADFERALELLPTHPQADYMRDQIAEWRGML